METIESRIDAAETRLKKLKAQRQQIEACKRTEDIRRKILIGAVILAKVEQGEWPQARLLAMMDKALTRPDDRALFDFRSTLATSPENQSDLP